MTTISPQDTMDTASASQVVADTEGTVVKLYPTRPLQLTGGEPLTVPTGVAITVPDGWLAMICPAPDLAKRKAVSLLGAPEVVGPCERQPVQATLLYLREGKKNVNRDQAIARVALVASDRIPPLYQAS